MFEHKNGTIRLYGAVGFDDGFTHEQLLGALDSAGGDDISIRMSSVGGDVDEGFKLYNELAEYPGKVSIRIDTQAYSIASIVMLAGDEVTASENAEIMIHNAWTIGLGNAKEFRELADILDRRDYQLADTYAKHAGESREFWLGEMAKESYYSSAEALELGLIGGVVEPTTGTKGKAVAMVRASASPVLAVQRRRREILKTRARLR